VNRRREGEETVRTKDEDKDPCAVTYEEEEDGGAAPTVMEGNDKLEKSEGKEDGLEGNKGNAVKE
jgi:hypothetical protein